MIILRKQVLTEVVCGLPRKHMWPRIYKSEDQMLESCISKNPSIGPLWVSCGGWSASHSYSPFRCHHAVNKQTPTGSKIFRTGSSETLKLCCVHVECFVKFYL